MGATHLPIHVRLDRHSRRRRMLMISREAAANPSMYEDQVKDQIFLDPKIYELVHASAEYMERKQSLLSGETATPGQHGGQSLESAVLADFPEVEESISPPAGESTPVDSLSAPDSVFDEIGGGEHVSPVQLPEKAEVKSSQEIHPTEDVVQDSSDRKKRRDLDRLIDSQPLGSSDGLNRVREFLHQPQSRVWMFVGDQTTAWLRYQSEPGYAEMFRHRIRWELRRFPDLIVNAGFEPAKIDDLFTMTRQGLSQCHADAVFMMPGLVDREAAVKSPFEYTEKLKQLAEMIRSESAEPILQTPPLPDVDHVSESESLLILADLIRDVAIVEGIALIDHAEFWQENGQASWWQVPGELISQAGQRALAMLFFSELDLFDRSSQLCSKMQAIWNDDTADHVLETSLNRS